MISYKRPFITVLIISLSWHLFWMLLISIVILPNNFSANKYRPVNFLGSLFSEINLWPAALNKASADFNLGSKIEAASIMVQLENNENLPLASNIFLENSPDIKEAKEIPNLINIVSLSNYNYYNEMEQLKLGGAMECSLSNLGRVILTNRWLTSSEPEEDMLKVRALWQKSLYVKQ